MSADATALPSARLRITFEGRPYDVLVEFLPESSRPATQSQVRATTAPAPAPAAGNPPEVVRSPVAGTVTSVSIASGQAVDEGASLLTLESMKMNTWIFAPRAGRVAGVHVVKGDAVEQGRALVTIT